MAERNPNPPPIGWPLLPLPDAAGRLRWPGLEESVRQSIEVLLRTRPGERLMRPELGAGLAELLHEPNTITTRRRIRDRIAEALAQWERRIAVDRIEVWEVPGQPSEVRVEIAYRLRRTGAARRAALTLELGS
jgi:phage baseplate assembly protein W